MIQQPLPIINFSLTVFKILLIRLLHRQSYSSLYASRCSLFTNNILGDSASHPRKSSFGSSALFSTSSPHPLSSRRVVRNDSVSSSHPHSVSNASNKRLNQTENSTIEHQINSPSSESPHNVESSTIYTKGHVLQRILFRSYATCDLCQNSCSGVFHPPVSYQCTDCQVRV